MENNNTQFADNHIGMVSRQGDWVVKEALQV